MNKTWTPGSQGSQELEALCCISVDVVGDLSILECLDLDPRNDRWNDISPKLFNFPPNSFTQLVADFGRLQDAVAGWLGSYGGEDSTSDISRG